MSDYVSYDNRPWQEHDERQRECIPVTPQQAKIAEMFSSMEGIKLAAAAPELLAALEAISAIAGNLPDDRLTTRTGANDAVARGLMVTETRRIARAAIAKAKGEA